MVLLLVVFWFACMVCGWFIFYSTIESSESSSSVSSGDGGVIVVPPTLPSQGEGMRGENRVTAAAGVAIKTNEQENLIPKQEEPLHHSLHEPVPLVPHPPVVSHVEKPLPDLKDLIQPNVEVKQPQQPPQPLRRTAEMWRMSVGEQRRYLQNLHQHEEEPSLRSANEFIQYAQQSFTLPPENLPVNDPVNAIWPYPATQTTYDPQVGFGSPGQSKVPYHIAGKDVKLPYGYPEESIFILTASYRDPEVASTIARAYAR